MPLRCIRATDLLSGHPRSEAPLRAARAAARSE